MLDLEGAWKDLEGLEGAWRGGVGDKNSPPPALQGYIVQGTVLILWWNQNIKITFPVPLMYFNYFNYLIILVRKQSYADNEHYLRKSASVQIIAHEPSRCEGCFDGRLPLLMVVIFIASVIFLLCVGVVVDFQSKYWIFVFLQIKINKWTVFMDLLRP